VAERSRFDPYGLLQALDRYRVTFVVIGGFARIAQGTEEMTYGLDITPSMREENLRLVPEPAGTRGYDDLRRAANREPLGRGVRPSVASIGDLARMVSALGDEGRIPQLMQLRRLVELERSRDRVLQR
jgi:hypothetical protein